MKSTAAFDDLYAVTGADGPRWPLEPNPTHDAEPLPELDRDRARGALLGLAIGDALGATLEFEQPPPAPFTPPLLGPHDHITGGGPFSVVKGQVTDDTQMAACLTTSLLEEGGFDAEAVAASYVRWSRVAFDVGFQTRVALGRVARGMPAIAAGRKQWVEKGREAAGNGSLMRTTPIAIAYPHRAGRRRAVSMVDSAITHFDPRCQIACAAFNAAIATAVTNAKTDARGMFEAARTEVPVAAEWMESSEPHEVARIGRAADDLLSDLAAAESDDPDLWSAEVHLHHVAGFVRVAFRLSFWQLLHRSNPTEALIDTVNRGGDSDTNGAIVGALLGACHGESSLPTHWRELVITALEGETSSYRTLYHPTRLLELLEP